MKGWHSEIMGYAPAHSGVFVCRWIPKILRGIRREFPSKLKGREAHSVVCFLPMREKYEFLLLWKELFKNPSFGADKNCRSRRSIKHVISLHQLDQAGMLHQCVLETMAVSLCRVGEAMPTRERMLKVSRSDLAFRYDNEARLLEAKLMLIPLKKAVRNRKFGRKVLIIIPAISFARTSRAASNSSGSTSQVRNFAENSGRVKRVFICANET